MTTTKVSRGQTWENLDPRLNFSMLTVKKVIRSGVRPRAEVIYDTGRKTTILLRRFRDTNRGYRLVD